MKSTKTMTLIVLVLLALGSAWLLPSMAGQGQGKSLVKRVEALEELVAELADRVEALEQGPPANSFDVLHLNPLDDFPSNPSDGDMCVMQAPAEPPPSGIHYFVRWYFAGDWQTTPYIVY